MLETGRSLGGSDAEGDVAAESPPIGSVPICEVCGSTDVSDTVCLEHLSCGYTASITTFEFNNFVCPRCGKKLVREHVDYRKVIVRVCHNCGHVARVGEVTAFEGVEAGIQIERGPPSSMNLNSWINHVGNTLRRLGLKYLRDYEVRGASGAVHRWDFAVWLSEGERPEIVIKFNLTNSSKPFLRPLDNIFDVLSIAIKKADSGIRHLILVMDYEGTGNLFKTCEELNIRLISVNRKKLFTETIKHLMEMARGSKS